MALMALARRRTLAAFLALARACRPRWTPGERRERSVAAALFVLFALAAAGAAGCESAPPPDGGGTAPLTGTVSVPPGATGNAYLFLFRPGEGPPALPAEPLYATAISAARLADDPHFVFAGAPAAAYRLWGFLDRDRDLSLEVDLLAQPSAGDLAGRGVELGKDPRAIAAPVALDVPTAFDPPAFEIPGVTSSFVVLPDQPLLPVRFTIGTTRLSDRLQQVAFAVSLVDRDADGAPDDADGDGLADLYPRIAFRFLPRPGQTDPAGDVLLPALIESELQLRAALGDDPALALPVDQLALTLLPFAIDGAGETLPIIPVGEYQLAVVEASGQVWTVPNDLGDSEPGQAIRFFVQHALFATGLP